MSGQPVKIFTIYIRLLFKHKRWPYQLHNGNTQIQTINVTKLKCIRMIH